MPRPSRACVKDTNRRLSNYWKENGREDSQEVLDDFPAPKLKRVKSSGQAESGDTLVVEKVKTEVEDSITDGRNEREDVEIVPPPLFDHSQSQLDWSTPTTGLTQETELSEETNKDLFTQRYLESVLVNFEDTITQIGVLETLQETLGNLTPKMENLRKKTVLTKFRLTGDQNCDDHLFLSSVSQDRFPW